MTELGVTPALSALIETAVVDYRALERARLRFVRLSPTDGLRLLDGRYRGVSIPFSVFPLALPELGQSCFGFMLHNPSKRSILSLGDCLIEARFSSERFVFHALASSFFLPRLPKVSVRC